jgi:hypothetical protein
MALGLITSNSQSNYWMRNIRRRVSYDFPEGAAPLTSLLSLMDTGPKTPYQEFGWPEERYTSIKTKTSTTGQPTADTPFYLAGTTTTAGAPITISLTQNLRVYVDDVSNFQVDDVIHIVQVALTSGSDTLQGRVIGKGGTTGAYWLEFVPSNIPIGVTATVLNTSANEGKWVYLAGSAYAEGSRSRQGRSTLPIEVKNFTQFHKNAFSLTSHALQAPTVYNKTGDYEKAKKTNGIIHLEGIERTSIFGNRSAAAVVEVDPDTGESVRRYQSGGILWYLKQWELGTAGVGGATNGYPHAGGTDNISTIARTDWESYIDKRIIQLDSAVITKAQFNKLTARPFEKCNAISRDKLVLCGPDYLTKVSEAFEKQIQWTSLRDSGIDGWNFQLKKHESNAGTVYYKVHPLFQDIIYRSSALYLDLGWLQWRPFAEHDTQLVTSIQANDAHVRKDMYYTDGGLEVGFPEAHMFVENLGGITL